MAYRKAGKQSLAKEAGSKSRSIWRGMAGTATRLAHFLHRGNLGAWVTRAVSVAMFALNPSVQASRSFLPSRACGFQRGNVSLAFGNALVPGVSRAGVFLVRPKKLFSSRVQCKECRLFCVSRADRGEPATRCHHNPAGSRNPKEWQPIHSGLKC